MKIKGIIEKYANAKEIEGGKSIYNRKMILKFSSNETQFHHAHVFGSLGDIYKMQFSISSQGHLTSSCNCSYYGEGICKHLVAALYYLDLNTNYAVDQKELEKNKVERTDTSLPFELFVADLNHLDSIASFEDYGLAHRRLPWIQNFGIDDTHIIIEIPDQHMEQTVDVLIQPKKGKLKITSNPKETCDGLTISELTALVFLKKKEKESPSFFSALLSSTLFRQIARTLTREVTRGIMGSLGLHKKTTRRRRRY